MICEHSVFRGKPEAMSTADAPLLFSRSSELILEGLQDVFSLRCLVNQNGALVRRHEQLDIIIREPQGVVPAAVGDDFFRIYGRDWFAKSP